MSAQLTAQGRRPRRRPAGARRTPTRRRGAIASFLRRLIATLGPIAGGIALDAIDFAAMGPAGFVVGGVVGFLLAGAYGARLRHRVIIALVSAVYCTNFVPVLRYVPLATLVGAWFRYRGIGVGTAADEVEARAPSVTEKETHMQTTDRDDPPADDIDPTRVRPHGAMSAILATIVALVVGGTVFWWYFCRIEPGPGKLAVLIRKTGRDLPSGQILALEPNQKGIQLDVLAEGRHFRNPYTWGWEIWPLVDIPAGALGVVTRLYGDDLPAGGILAKPGSKGILAETLGLGKHRINPYAYQVDIQPAISIRAGHVGVKTFLVGDDVIDGQLSRDERNTFLVGVTNGLKGVVGEVLDPGTYYLNPYVVNVVEVNLQSQRFEMSGDDAIGFLTLDGFAISVEGTIEFGIERAGAALITHRVGDMEDIVTKVIMPRARGFSRIEGSKYPAIDFIVGETRQQFQRQLEDHLHTKCTDWGVAIKSVLVRRIVVPDEIASISRQREIAVQDARKFAQQTEQAKSKAELVKQEMLALQNKAKVEVETENIRATIEAKQDQQVRQIAARRELEVAKVENQAAAFQAESVRLKAAGDRDAVTAANEAEVAVLRSQVTALGSGANLARYTFGKAVAPRIDSVLASDSAGGIGALFGPLLPPGAAAKEVTP